MVKEKADTSKIALDLLRELSPQKCASLAAKALAQSFIWDDSSEGFDFWYAVYIKLLDFGTGGRKEIKNAT